MTKERLNKELLYQASLSPFKAMLGDGVISEEDYRVIDTILRMQYSPIFVEKSYQIPLDNTEE
jgi:hypothetical protein